VKAVVWHGKRDVRVDEVPDPVIQEPTDAIVRITTTNICGSDLHLYETLGPFMGVGDILGHEPMGIVEEVGSQAGSLKVGDRVVLPFQISLRLVLDDAVRPRRCAVLTDLRGLQALAALFLQALRRGAGRSG